MIKKFTVLLVLAIMFCALPITTNAESYNEEFYNEKLMKLYKKENGNHIHQNHQIHQQRHLILS